MYENSSTCIEFISIKMSNSLKDFLKYKIIHSNNQCIICLTPYVLCKQLSNFKLRGRSIMDIFWHCTIYTIFWYILFTLLRVFNSILVLNCIQMFLPSFNTHICPKLFNVMNKTKWMISVWKNLKWNRNLRWNFSHSRYCSKFISH